FLIRDSSPTPRFLGSGNRFNMVICGSWFEESIRSGVLLFSFIHLISKAPEKRGPVSQDRASHNRRVFKLSLNRCGKDEGGPRGGPPSKGLPVERAARNGGGVPEQAQATLAHPQRPVKAYSAA